MVWFKAFLITMPILPDVYMDTKRKFIITVEYCFNCFLVCDKFQLFVQNTTIIFNCSGRKAIYIIEPRDVKVRASAVRDIKTHVDSMIISTSRVVRNHVFVVSNRS